MRWLAFILALGGLPAQGVPFRNLDFEEVNLQAVDRFGQGPWIHDYGSGKMTDMLPGWRAFWPDREAPGSGYNWPGTDVFQGQPAVNVVQRGVVDDIFHGWSERFAISGEYALLIQSRNFVGASTLTLQQAGDIPAGMKYLEYEAVYAVDHVLINGVEVPGEFLGVDRPDRVPCAVFCFQRSSYVADFNLSNNNLLRAMLSAPETALVVVDKLSGVLQIEGMAIGDHIGACWQRNVNEPLSINPASDLTRDVCLLGDPTLRLHVTKPPTGVGIVLQPSLQLTWTASEPNATYHVYHASSLAGTFTRQNSQPVAGTSFPIASSGGVFMVRAIKLVTSGSGSYYNLSQGAFYP